MCAHAAVPTAQRHHRVSAAIIVPVALGVAFGAYAAWLDSDQGSSTNRAFLVGLISAVVIGGLCYAIGHEQSTLMPELVAIAYGALFGCAMGFLYSLSGATWLKAGGMGLGFSAAMGFVAYYVVYIRRD